MKKKKRQNEESFAHRDTCECSSEIFFSLVSLSHRTFSSTGLYKESSVNTNMISFKFRLLSVQAISISWLLYLSLSLSNFCCLSLSIHHQFICFCYCFRSQLRFFAFFFYNFLFFTSHRTFVIA